MLLGGEGKAVARRDRNSSVSSGCVKCITTNTPQFIVLLLFMKLHATETPLPAFFDLSS